MCRVSLLLLLLMLWISGNLVCGWEDLEIDEEVAPPTVAPRPVFNLWRNVLGQFHQIQQRWHRSTTLPTTTTKHPRVLLRSTTTEPEQELHYYGALNPIFQMNNF